MPKPDRFADVIFDGKDRSSGLIVLESLEVEAMVVHFPPRPLGNGERAVRKGIGNIVVSCSEQLRSVCRDSLGLNCLGSVGILANPWVITAQFSCPHVECPYL